MPELDNSTPVESVATSRAGFPWRWLWLLLPIAFFLWWILGRTPSYRLIGSYPADDILLVPATSGFLTRERGNSFTLRAWSGTPRWSVTPPVPRLSGTSGPRTGAPGFGAAYGLSPDGRIFAAATADRTGIRVQSWRDGHLIGAVLLATEPRILMSVRVQDTGRVFCWFSSRADTPVYVIEGRQVVARGSLLPDALVAPDGSAVVSAARTYATVQVKGGAVTLADIRTIPDPLPPSYRVSGFVLESTMGIRGHVLAANGAVYNRAGRVRAANDWVHEGIAPGGRFTLEHRERQTRVYAPDTGEAWTVTVPHDNLGGDATSDGRHALVWQSITTGEEFARFLQRFPFVVQMVGELSPEYFTLYTHPGRRTAVLRMRLRAWWPEAGEVSDRWWFPSPDGRYIAMTVGNMREARCLVFRY